MASLHIKINRKEWLRRLFRFKPIPHYEIELHGLSNWEEAQEILTHLPTNISFDIKYQQSPLDKFYQ